MNEQCSFRRTVSRYAGLGLLCIAWFALASCAAPKTVLVAHPDGTRISLLSEQPAAPNGIDPTFASIAPLQIEASLRRITITHDTWISFVQSDPKPLLSPDLVREIHAPLAEALSKLTPGQRVLVEFLDPYKQKSVRMVVYPDGAELVYQFLALIRDEEKREPQDPPSDQGTLVAQPGQTIAKGNQSSTLRESIRQSDFARAELAGQMQQRIEEAYKAHTVSSEERARLLALTATERMPTEDSWKLFWEKWDLLYKAQQAELVNADTYAERKAHLIEGLGR